MCIRWDPDNLPIGDPSKIDFGSWPTRSVKAWRDIWGAGQGIGAVKSVQPAAALVDRLATEYADAVRGATTLAHAE